MKQMDLICSEECDSEKFSVPDAGNQIETYQCLQNITSGSLNLYVQNWNKTVLVFPLTPLLQLEILPQNRNQTIASSIHITSANHASRFCWQIFLKWMSL